MGEETYYSKMEEVMVVEVVGTCRCKWAVVMEMAVEVTYRCMEEE